MILNYRLLLSSGSTIHRPSSSIANIRNRNSLKQEQEEETQELGIRINMTSWRFKRKKDALIKSSTKKVQVRTQKVPPEIKNYQWYQQWHGITWKTDCLHTPSIKRYDISSHIMKSTSRISQKVMNFQEIYSCKIISPIRKSI